MFSLRAFQRLLSLLVMLHYEKDEGLKIEGFGGVKGHPTAMTPVKEPF